MFDLTVEKLVPFIFAVLPGVIAMQVYGLKCPGTKRDWGNSLIEVVSYSVVNLTIWMFWVRSIVERPFSNVSSFELIAAIICVCFLSPILLALACHKLRTTYLHKFLRFDHPTPRAWDFFVRNNHEFWILFHFKNGTMAGGYFGENSFAATFPQDPEIYVEELWRVNERGEFLEPVMGTNGGVIRIAECERVEFFKIQHEGSNDGSGTKDNGKSEARPNGGPTGSQECRTDGKILDAGQQGEATPGRLVNGSAEQPTKVT